MARLKTANRYLVMELVKGETLGELMLTEKLTAGGPNQESRASLFKTAMLVKLFREHGSHKKGNPKRWELRVAVVSARSEF